MAKRRYRSTLRASRSKRRRGMKSRRRRLLRGGLRQPVQYFKRTVYIPAWHTQASGVPGVGRFIRFTLSDVPSAPDFSTLYDQYQIKAIKVTVIPKHTDATIGLGVQSNYWTVLDYDDSNSPATLDELLQYQNVKRTRMSSIHKRYLRPCVNHELTQTSGVVAHNPRRNTWIDCAADLVAHRGVKFWFDSTPTAAVFDLQVQYYLAFKNVR